MRRSRLPHLQPPGVRGMYAKTQCLDQRREMLAQWSNMLDAAMAEASKVVVGKFACAAQP